MHRGYLIYDWGPPDTLYGLKSTTKSIGVTTLGLALRDGLLGLDDLADDLHPDFANPPSSNLATGWVDLVSLTHLATHSAGFGKSGGYTAFLFEPGTAWSYSDGGPNWLAEIVTLAYRQDLWVLLENRILNPIGADPNHLSWRDNQYRPDLIEGIKRREFGSGISATRRDGAHRAAVSAPGALAGAAAAARDLHRAGERHASGARRP
ncbi:MAG: serine hydrolase [Myxococcota bacterium]